MKDLYQQLETLGTRILKEMTAGEAVEDPQAAESILQIIKFAKANVAKYSGKPVTFPPKRKG